MPVGGSVTSSAAASSLRATVSVAATRVHIVHESRCPEIGPICEVRDEPPNLHDQLIWPVELRAILEYGIDEAWAVEVQVPLRLTATTITYRTLAGEAFTPDYANIHHRDETLAGFGDPWLRARFAFELLGLEVALKAGVTLPFGRTERDPFALGRMGIEHQHIQFGTGTIDVLLALQLSRAFGPVQVGAYAQALLVPYESGKGFRAGHRLGGGVEASMTVAGPLHASLGLDLYGETPEEWDGAVQQDGNLGRVDLLAGGGLSVALEAVELAATVRAPVYQHVIMSEHEAGELSYPAIITVSASRAF